MPSKRISGTCSGRRKAVRSSLSNSTSLILRIGQTYYVLARIDADPAVAVDAWRLRKLDSTVTYDVAVQADGPTCECKDYLTRTANSPRGCKHIRALTAHHLIGGTQP